MMRTLTIVLSAFLLFSACKKDKKKKDDTPPPHTQNGANILSCKVDGVWHNYSGIPTLMHDDGVNYYNMIGGKGYYTRILADKTEYNDQIVIDVYEQHPVIGQVYYLSSESQNLADYIKGSADYYAPLNSGQIIFTRCDSLVAAGTFYFTAVRNNDTIKVTEGFFDIARSK